MESRPVEAGRWRGSSSFSLVLMDGATQAAHNGRVTFNVSTTATDRPFVGLRCWQGTNWVYDGYVGYFPGAMFDPWFTLDSPYWADGAPASCTARLFYYDRRGNQNVLTQELPRRSLANAQVFPSGAASTAAPTVSFGTIPASGDGNSAGARPMVL